MKNLKFLAHLTSIIRHTSVKYVSSVMKSSDSVRTHFLYHFAHANVVVSDLS